MTKYRKKPVVVDAVQFFPDQKPWPGGIKEDAASPTGYSIGTLESREGHEVTPGDFVITGVKGECYACKPDIFEMTYELAE